jgi:hypothetical protein
VRKVGRVANVVIVAEQCSPQALYCYLPRLKVRFLRPLLLSLSVLTVEVSLPPLVPRLPHTLHPPPPRDGVHQGHPLPLRPPRDLHTPAHGRIPRHTHHHPPLRLPDPFQGLHRRLPLAVALHPAIRTREQRLCPFRQPDCTNGRLRGTETVAEN